VKYILDTNAISEPFRPAPSPAFMRRFAEYRALVYISVVTWQELVSGAARMPRGRRRQAIERYHALVRESFAILPLDEVAATWAGREDARLARSGITVTCEDLQIAAIAATRDLTLVTADAVFRRFRGLETADWMGEGG
jgi:tRNA(fMet)-specific endonuclease VapC